MFLTYLFFILLLGLAFRLRGIWGHQLGGAIFGVLLGFGVVLSLSLPFENSILMILALMIIYSIASFVGWFQKKGFTRFLTGYVIYGMFPNIILCVFLFSNSIISSLELIFMGSLGMGIGFALSEILLSRMRKLIKRRFHAKNPDLLELVFDKLKSNKEISHIYHTKFNTWTYLMEIPSGALYGISTMIILDLNQSSINLLSLDIGILQNIIIFFIFGPISALLFVIGYKKKTDIDPNKPSMNQIRWSSPQFVKNSIITSMIFIIFGLVIMTLWNKIDTEFLFLILLWIIIVSARISCENNSKMMKIDFIFDLVCGFILSGLCFWNF